MSQAGKLYQDLILEHHRAPRHAVAVSAPTHRAELNNPLCGDRVTLTLSIVDGRVLEVGCEVKGCAICRASGSMLGEALVGAEVAAALANGERFLAAFGQPGAGAPVSPTEQDANLEAWGPLDALLEARRYPNRLRCATLPWEALQRALRAAPREPGTD